jgi:SAM-dependent methyltransferase
MSETAATRAAATSVRFPAISFASYAEYRAARDVGRVELEQRHQHERSLALPSGEHVRAGSCAPCLRQTQFTVSTAGGAPADDGRISPVWRDQLVCDCPDRLTNRDRAILHFASAWPLLPWQRVMAFGRMSSAGAAMCRRLGETLSVRRMLADASSGPRIAARDACCDLLISLDYLQNVPPLPLALAEMRRVLSPGGRLIFTVPFRADRPATLSHIPTAADAQTPVESAREAHEFGWDILDQLRAAGFSRCRAHVYWSVELGYLGASNILFSAEN